MDQQFLRALGLFYDFSEICFGIPQNLKDKLKILQDNFKKLNLEGELDEATLLLIESFKKVIETFENSENPKISNFSTISENRISMSHILI